MKKTLFAALAPLSLVFSGCSIPQDVEADPQAQTETHTQSIFADGSYSHNFSDVFTSKDDVEVFATFSVETQDREEAGFLHDGMGQTARTLAAEFFGKYSSEDIAAKASELKEEAAEYITKGLKATGYNIVSAKLKDANVSVENNKPTETLRHILTDLDTMDKTNCSRILNACF